MQYRTSKCPHCGYKLEVMEPTGINDYTDQFGPPIIACPQCNGKIKTRRQYWDDMLPFDRFMAWVRMIFTIFVHSIFLLILTYVIVWKVFHAEDTLENTLVVVPAIALSLTASAFFNINAFNKLRSMKPDQ